MLLNNGEYVLSSAINIGEGLVHAIFHGKTFQVGRYMSLNYYISLPKNDLVTLSQVDSQAKLKAAPNEYQIELSE